MIPLFLLFRLKSQAPFEHVERDLAVEDASVELFEVETGAHFELHLLFHPSDVDVPDLVAHGLAGVCDVPGRARGHSGNCRNYQ